MTTKIIARQRRAIRRAVRIPCRVVRSLDAQLLGTQTLDLSPDGMLVPCDAGAEIGDACLVTFTFTDLSIRFAAEATIARVLQGRRPGDPGRAVGLRFQNFDAVKRLILSGHLRKIPPPLPQREQRIDYAATIWQIAYG